jgi:hypothetical protein
MKYPRIKNKKLFASPSADEINKVIKIFPSQPWTRFENKNRDVFVSYLKDN